jgi:hypothetical protein
MATKRQGRKPAAKKSASTSKVTFSKWDVADHLRTEADAVALVACRASRVTAASRVKVYIERLPGARIPASARYSKLHARSASSCGLRRRSASVP